VGAPAVKTQTSSTENEKCWCSWRTQPFLGKKLSPQRRLKSRGHSDVRDRGPTPPGSRARKKDRPRKEAAWKGRSGQRRRTAARAESPTRGKPRRPLIKGKETPLADRARKERGARVRARKKSHERTAGREEKAEHDR